MADEQPQLALADLLLTATNGADTSAGRIRRPGSARPYASGGRVSEAARGRFPLKASDHSLLRSTDTVVMQRPGSAPPLQTRRTEPRRMPSMEWEAAPRPRRTGSAGVPRPAPAGAGQQLHPRLNRAARVFQMRVASHQPSTPESLHAEKLTSPGMPFIESAVAMTVDSVELEWRAPLNNGGASVTGFRVQYREVSTPPDRCPSIADAAAYVPESTAWTSGPLHTYDIDGSQRTIQLRGLPSAATIMIRICALNAFGRGRYTQYEKILLPTRLSLQVDRSRSGEKALLLHWTLPGAALADSRRGAPQSFLVEFQKLEPAPAAAGEVQGDEALARVGSTEMLTIPAAGAKVVPDANKSTSGGRSESLSKRSRRRKKRRGKVSKHLYKPTRLKGMHIMSGAGAHVQNEDEEAEDPGYELLLAGLEQHAWYEVRMREVYASGHKGKWSDLRRARTLPGVPSAPTIEKTNESSTQIVVEWEAAAEQEESVYAMEFWTEAAGSAMRLAIDRSELKPAAGWPRSHSCVLTKLWPGTTYNLRVVVANAGGRAASGVLSRTTGPHDAIPCMKNVGATCGERECSIRVAWELEEAAPAYSLDVLSDQHAHYQLEYRYSEDSDERGYPNEVGTPAAGQPRAWTCVKVPASNGTSLLLDGTISAGLQPSTCYDVRARAVTRHGAGHWRAVDGMVTTTVSPPTISDVDLSPTGTELRWSMDSRYGTCSHLEFECQAVIDGRGEKVAARATSFAACRADLHGLLPAQTYHLSVRAVWGEKASIWSKSTVIVTPHAVSVSTGSSSICTAELNWALHPSATALVAKWRLEYYLETEPFSQVPEFVSKELDKKDPKTKLDIGNRMAEIVVTRLPGTSAGTELGGLRPGSSYRWRAVAEIGDEEYFASPWAIFASAAGVPDAPTVRDTEVTDSSFVAMLSAPRDNGSRILALEAALEFGGETAVRGLDANADYCFFSDLTCGSKYTLRLRAQNDLGWCDWGEPIQISTFNLIGNPSAPEVRLAQVTSSAVLLNWSLTDPGKAPPVFTVEYKQANSFMGWYKACENLDSAESCIGFEVTGLAGETQYDFRVLAQNSYGLSHSAVLVAKTSVDAAKPPPSSSEPAPKDELEQVRPTQQQSSSSTANPDKVTAPNWSEELLIWDEAIGSESIRVGWSHNVAVAAEYVVEMALDSIESVCTRVADLMVSEGSVSASSIASLRNLIDSNGCNSNALQRAAESGQSLPQDEAEMLLQILFSDSANMLIIDTIQSAIAGGSDITGGMPMWMPMDTVEIDGSMQATRASNIDQLDPGQWYRLRVKCIVDGEEQQCSKPITRRTNEADDAAISMQNIKIENVTTSKISLSWSGGCDRYEVRYRVREQSTAAQEWTRFFVQQTAAQLPHQTSASFSCGSIVEVGMRGVSSKCVGPWSASQSATTNYSPPGSPMVDTLSVDATTVAVTWHGTSDGGQQVQKYEIRWQSSGKVDSHTISRESAEGELKCTYAIAGLEPRTKYSIDVRAANFVGYGEWSTGAEISTPVLPAVAELHSALTQQDMWRVLDILIRCATEPHGLGRLAQFYKGTYETDLSKVISGALMLKKSGFMATSSRQSVSDEGLHCDIVFQAMLQSTSAKVSGVSYDKLWVGQHVSTIAANLHSAITQSFRSTVVAIIIALFKSDVAAEVADEYVTHYAYSIQEHVLEKFGLPPTPGQEVLHASEAKASTTTDQLNFAGVLIRIMDARTSGSPLTTITKATVQQMHSIINGPSDATSVSNLLRQLQAMPRKQLEVAEKMFERRFGRPITSSNLCSEWSSSRPLFSAMGLGMPSPPQDSPHIQPKQVAASVSAMLEQVNKSYDKTKLERLSSLLLQLTAQQLSQVTDEYNAVAKEGHSLHQDLADNTVLVHRGLLSLLACATEA